MRDLKDYVIPLITPYTEAGNVDIPAARKIARYIADLPGCGAVYFGSVYQEFWALGLFERIELMAAMIDEVNADMPVVAGVSSASLTDTLSLVNAATQQGADYLMIWPPIFGPRDERGVREFYRRVLDHTELPSFVYSTHLEELGYYLTSPTIEALADEFPHVFGIKEGSADLTKFLDLTRRLGSRLKVGTPFEEYWITAKLAYPDLAADFLMGSSRAMYMQSRERPYVATALDRLRNGDISGGFIALAQVADLVNLQMDSFARGVHPIALAKYVLSVISGSSPSVREPTPTLDRGTTTAIFDVLRRLGLVESAAATADAV
jgi:4-hydroxy-tetrahydrodipicolinate synthase